MPAPNTSTAFWELIDGWGLPDDIALKLIGQAASDSGKRPRFALTTEQIDRLALLRQIQEAGSAVHQDVGAWLLRPNRSTVFGGKAPIRLAASQGMPGLEALLAHLQFLTFKGSAAASRPDPDRGQPKRARSR